jgi:transcription termination/antitermination protein NusA
MKTEFELAFNEIAELRSLPRDIVLEALQNALISAYRRDTGASAAQRVEVNIDANTGRARIFVEKEVVDDVMHPNTEVDLEKARYYDPEANLGDMVMVQVEGTTRSFGRIAAQTAKQVILQKIREAERKAVFEEYVDREGDLVTGTVQSVNAAMLTISLGRAEAIMPRAQQIPGERYKPHDKLRAYLMEVKQGNRGPQIVISRAHRNMLRRLLEYEVPEIFNGQVEIKNIAREAGYRSKVAVAALQEGIDPVGACVGMRGIRIQNIVKELHDEKIDVIEWNPNQEMFIAKALSPARVTGVYLDDDPDSGKTAIVIVPDDQLSLAIGREGQNARLAAKLTGWRIDIKNVTEAVQEALTGLDTPAMVEVRDQQAVLIEDVRRVLEKKLDNKSVTAEELNLMARFADMVERRAMARKVQARQARLAEINAVKSTLPPQAFKLPVSKLDLPDEIIEALTPLDSVGEIMLRFLIDETRLHRLLSNLPEDAIVKVQAALDRFVMPEEELVAIEVTEAPVEEISPVVTPASDEEAINLAAFADEPEVAKPTPKKLTPPPVRQPAVTLYQDEAEGDPSVLEDGDKGDGKKGKTKKERQQRRQLIFDEEIGQVIARRRRKGGRGGDDWMEEDE